MKKVKITVLRATFIEDLALEYGMPGLKPCSVMKQGQVFYAAHAKPDGFCDGAWRTIYQYVFALANGARSFYYNDWIRQPGVAIACCNDGLRPCFSSWRPPTRRSERRSIRERVGHDSVRYWGDYSLEWSCFRCVPYLRRPDDGSEIL